MKLHQLSNGNWIDPSQITGIVRLEREQCLTGTIFPDRLIIHCGHMIEVCSCDDAEQALAMQTELASIVNA